MMIEESFHDHQSDVEDWPAAEPVAEMAEDNGPEGPGDKTDTEGREGSQLGARRDQPAEEQLREQRSRQRAVDGEVEVLQR